MGPLVGLAGRSARPIWFCIARIGALPFLWYLARAAHDHPVQGSGQLGFILFFMLAVALLGRVVLALAWPVLARVDAASRPDALTLLLHLGFVLIAW